METAKKANPYIIVFLSDGSREYWLPANPVAEAAVDRIGHALHNGRDLMTLLSVTDQPLAVSVTTSSETALRPIV